MAKISKNAAIHMLIGLATAIFLGNPESAQADAWWGEGFKKPDWVLEHGGSIINYKIKGKEDSDDYKARMYLGNDVMEIEYGGSGYFDDAINNTYTIIIFKGTDIKDKTVVSVVPGETVNLKFDLKKEKVEKTSEILPKYQVKLNSDSSRYISQSEVEPAVKPLEGRNSDSSQKKADTEQDKPALTKEKTQTEASLSLGATCDKNNVILLEFPGMLAGF